MTELIYHVAFVSDWQASKSEGLYRISGRGMTLESEGYLHFSYAGQVAGVTRRFWRDPEGPVVLLTVDPELLDLPVVAENTSGGAELFPHVYGPLPVSAVIAVTPLSLSSDGVPELPELARAGQPGRALNQPQARSVRDDGTG